ncbi:MAG: hypothetical protein JW801_04230 [Bacteroidales bacterium]|nr:hypothetical protein [Bacteroidales bacterium]
MRVFLSFVLVLFLGSCKTVELTRDTNEKEAYRIYKQTIRDKNKLKLVYNTDSTFVICMTRAQLEGADAVSFLVIDLKDHSMNWKSINNYLSVEWLDNKTIKLKTRQGILPVTKPGDANTQSNLRFYDIEKKELVHNPLINENQRL